VRAPLRLVGRQPTRRAALPLPPPFALSHLLFAALPLLFLAPAWGSAQEYPSSPLLPPEELLVRMERSLAESADPLTRLRALYHLSILDRGRLHSAEQLLRELQAQGGGDSPLLLAYQGSIELLHARHGWFPPTRLLRVREGERSLDRAVDLAPREAEIRYLRLAATLNLPDFLRRSAIEAADRRHLLEALEEGGGRLPPELEGWVRGLLHPP